MAPLQGDCHGNSCAVWGSDNGNSLSDGTMHGQFSIYVSSAVSAPNFNCENAMLTLEISEFTTAQEIRYVPFGSKYVRMGLMAALGVGWSCEDAKVDFLYRLGRNVTLGCLGNSHL